MNKLEKFLRKLPLSEKKRVREVITRILAQNLVGLDTKPIKGSKGLSRVRTGDLRVIYLKKDTRVDIVDLGYRSEKTYRDV